MKSITNENNLGSSGGGGIELEDINPNKINTGDINGWLQLGVTSSNGCKAYIPVEGYGKIAFYLVSSVTMSFKWVYTDGTKSDTVASFSSSWTVYYDIPSDVISVEITSIYSSNSWANLYYSLLTDKQVIPTKVTADINPNKVNAGDVPGFVGIASSTSSTGNSVYIPIAGYSKIALAKIGSAVTVKFRWVYVDDTESADVATLTRDVWTDYYDISSNVKCIKIIASYSGTYVTPVYYSLLA